ncbi:LysR family transcriptional regulator [Tumebacillus avium]|uniref:LysR family transcriptional regulator n=1 Tax=Tumebacillus avium TaxID=1903704 RepID=UPI0018DF3BC6|nr:LysR family transcriptional regulator [Tumebacillus avium]
MTLLQFQVLMTVIETKSFTKAGEQLGLTQSAVSQTISALETALGVTLLNRSRSGITPTQIGERMLLHVREISRRTMLMKQEASASLGLEIGSLRIGSIPSMAAKLLPGIIGGFKSRFPGIELILFEGSREEIIEWVQGSVVDVGLLPLPLDGLMIHSLPLVQERFHVYLPPGHPLQHETAIAVEQLADEPFLLAKGSCDAPVREWFASRGLTPNVQFEVRDTSTILAMVQEGLGVTVLPEMGIPASLPNVAALPLSPEVTRTLGLAVRCLQTVSPAAAEFVNHAQAYVKKHCEACAAV